METNVKKLIIAFVLCATPAFATELPVPKPPETKEACMARIMAACDATRYTKYGKMGCVRIRQHRCR